ncbi:MAG TPA: hypothetical protein VHL11_04240 [Phototrophicaceae bacterium]|jgi:hypothetical protein|nr:hypothetical protein [Phototrophicaceae bacterium]
MLPPNLPSNASSYSQNLFNQAYSFLTTFPRSFYEECAISGSVARGVADQYSACETDLWSRELQTAHVYKPGWSRLEARSAHELMRESATGT